VQLTDKEGQSLITRLIFHIGLKELSAKDFVGASKKDEFLRTQARFLTNTIPAKGDGLLQFQRKAEPKGPLAAFGYDYFAEHAKTAGVATAKLLSYEGLWGGGEEYAYEVLNFADGKRNAQEIRDAVSAEYGPVPLEMVVEYLKALKAMSFGNEITSSGFCATEENMRMRAGTSWRILSVGNGTRRTKNGESSPVERRRQGQSSVQQRGHDVLCPYGCYGKRVC